MRAIEASASRASLPAPTSSSSPGSSSENVGGPPVKRLDWAIREGDLPPDADVDLLLAQLGGPLFYRRIIAH